VCRHQIEVAVEPAHADVYFADERYINPINTQARFEATVLNAPNNGVIWQVVNIGGGPGAGTIDPSGLYTAPPKGTIPSGYTDIIVATAKADPTRRAYAKVTLVGFGPEPAPEPVLEIFPKVAYLYYRDGTGTDNSYIDISNKALQFRTVIKNTASTAVTWSVSGDGSIDGNGFYRAPDHGLSPVPVDINAHLTADPGVSDKARIILINYHWPPTG
jgi:hypothetical protein